MNHSISAITRSAPATHAASGPRELGAGWGDAVRSASAVAQPLPFGAFEAPATGARAASGSVQPGQIGRDGRFEKFILALQALILDAPAAASRTDRVERMRAAAEELFGIDGLPQPVRPLGGPAAEQLGAEEAATAEPGPDPEASTFEPAEAAEVRPLSTEARAAPELRGVSEGAQALAGAMPDGAAERVAPGA